MDEERLRRAGMMERAALIEVKGRSGAYEILWSGGQ
jgi:hypothetical protein